MGAPLTNGQKAYLAQLASRARNFRAAVARGQGTPIDGRSEEAFRHEEVAAACGKLGLRCASQDDYAAIKGHFLELLGQHQRAFEAEVRSATESRRQAEAVLVRECEAFGLHLAYAEAICQRQFRCGLWDASEKQIWCLVYTVRNRGRKKREERGEREERTQSVREVAA